jgi:uncharacterized membrane protein YfcA
MNQRPPVSSDGGGDRTPPQRPLRARRTFDLTRAKIVIVFFTGLLTAIGSAVTGLAAQTAFAPMLSWMLGFSHEKALATALRYAVFVALGVVIGVFGAQAAPPQYLLQGLILMLCATVGAVIASPLSPRPEMQARRQFLQTIGIFVTFLTLTQAMRISELNPLTPFASWNMLWQIGLLGLGVGAVTQATGLAGGTLLVPVLTFLAGFRPNYAIALSSLVILLASALPAWSYNKKGLVDLAYGNPAAIGGFLGGLGGGLLLMRLPEKLALILFAVTAMFFCAREVARITLERSSKG